MSCFRKIGDHAIVLFLYGIATVIQAYDNAGAKLANPVTFRTIHTVIKELYNMKDVLR